MFRKFTALGAVCVTVSLSACASPTISRDQAGPAPIHYKETLAAYVKQTFFDPYSLRDVAISKPVPGTMMFKSGWIVCLQLNAKNRMGGYIGLNETSYLFQGEDIVAAPGEMALACQGVPLEPWPEMESH